MRVRYSFSSRRTGNIKNISKQRKSFSDIVDELIFSCNIIVEVLDARFIDETRNIALEKAIREKSKIIIYALNKADLVNINKKNEEMGLKNLYPFVLISCKTGFGANNLKDLIKSTANEISEEVNVGIIGYPNTGKSSLINMLVGRSSARTAKEAGFTKGIQKIKLSDNVNLFDTPGVIAKEEYSSIDLRKMANHAKVGARNYDKVKEPEFVISLLMKDYSKQIEKFYNVDSEGNSDVLIEKLGRKKNFLQKGNEIDVDRTSRLILKDWQEGKIKI